MKLVLKRIAGAGYKPYALHVEGGECLPGQASVKLEQEPDGLTRIVVEFLVDDRSVYVEGTKYEATES